MSDQQDINGPATRDKLDRLWFKLLNVFEDSFKDQKVPNSEMLGNIRLFLRDNNAQPAPEHKQRLQALFVKLTETLLELVSAGEMSSSQMEFVRRFLSDNGISKDTELKISLESLSDLAVPFRH